MFRPEPVRIESWVTRIRAASFTMAYEILDELPDGGRRVYARARTVLTPYVFTDERPRRIRDEERVGARAVPRARRAGGERPMSGHTYDCHVRFSDVDVYGHVNNVKYFEYYQEARIAFIASLSGDHLGTDPTMRQVVARIDVDYKRPILFRPEPYAVETSVLRIGTSSYALASRIVDADGTVYSTAEATLVAFDASTQRSRPLTAGRARAPRVGAGAAGGLRVTPRRC